MATDQDTLVGMGFPEDRVKHALGISKGLQEAMDWLLAHPEGPLPGGGGAPAPAARDLDENDEEDQELIKAALGRKINVTSAAEKTNGGVISGSEGAAAAVAAAPTTGSEGTELTGQEQPIAKSLKCSDCGQIFRNPEVAQLHAHRSGHENFEESTEEVRALNEDEKQAKLEELKERLKLKRANQAREDAELAKQNEEIRRKAGKETQHLKDDIKLKQAEKDARERVEDKRQEIMARNRVRADIEADKKRRAEEAAALKAARAGQPTPTTTSPAPPKPAQAPSSSSSTQARLQIRFPSGTIKPISLTVPAETTLSQLIEQIRSQGDVTQDFTLSMTYPRKALEERDMNKNMRELGLCPSSVLMAS